ncbi:MAG: right-handed parallel beta-helix repeat-containing protein [Phycisphaerae bacterium]|nr:right-handed parallel beta-helix repeat-containing protein [Phycisphaerae bacterium]
MRTLFASVLVLFLVVPLSAATYYIDVVNGDDTTGDGSEQSPWATMSKAEANATGGDIVYLRAGTYPKFTANKLYTPVRTDYLVWKAYPGESVTLEGLDLNRYWTQPDLGGFVCYMTFDGLYIHSDATGNLVSAQGASYVKLLNCMVEGDRDSTGQVISLRDSRYILIDGCDVSEGWFDIVLWGWDLTLRNSTVHGAVEDAIRIVNAKDILVEDCEIYDVGRNDELHNDGIQWFSTASGPVELQIPCSNVTFRRLHIHDIEDQDFWGAGGIFGTHTNFVFENLFLEETPTVAWELNIGDTEAVVRNCTIIGSMRFTPGSIGDVRNTITGSLYWENGSTKTYEDYNCIGTLTGSTAGAHTLIGYSPAYMDPDNGDFRLSPDSPCIDAGTSDSVPATDFLGLRRIDTVGAPNNGGGSDPFHDMGAFEYQGAAGGQLCAPLAVTVSNLGSGSGSVTVTADGYYEVTLREDRSGGISNFYDLSADPGKTLNFSSDGAWSSRIIDARYFTNSLFGGIHSGRVLSVVYSDSQMVVVKVTGTHLASGSYLPMDAYYTFHAPVFEGSFIDLDVFIENDTENTLSNSFMYVNLTVRSDPTGYTFDWQGTGTGSEPGDRSLIATVGETCTVPNVVAGRYFKYTELTLPSVGAGSDLTPPAMSLRGPASYPVAAGEVIHDHYVLATNIAAVPTIFVADDGAGTGSGTVTVTCPRFYEFVLDEATGSGIRKMFDLRVDPFRKTNLADTVFYQSCLFDMRVSSNSTLHKGNTANRLSVVADNGSTAVIRSTGVCMGLDTQIDYAFTPPNQTGTDVGIDVTFTNNTGAVVPSYNGDYVYLKVAPNPSGLTFDWQGAVDSDVDNHWMMASVGQNATVAPLASDLLISLQEYSYGDVQATDATPAEMSLKFGSASYAVNEVRVRSFLLSTNIADE